MAKVMAGEDNAMEQLYKLFNPGIRYYLGRQLGSRDLDNKVRNTFSIIVTAIQIGDIREPERLMGFVRTVARRQVAAYIEQNIKGRHEDADLATAGINVADGNENPEQEAMFHQRAEQMKDALAQLAERSREILVRYYLREQTQEQICREMRMTGTQFRLMKSRAKAKFGQMGKKELVRS